MSSLTYSTYPGAGEWLSTNMGFSMTVRVGDRIECSGQGGWHLKGEELIFPDNIEEEIAQAFRNVETNLKSAGGKGWSQVFRVNTYHTEITPEVSAHIVANYKKYMPDHKPIWTQIGVKQLGAPTMNVEIEVVAYDPQGQAK